MRWQCLTEQEITWTHYNGQTRTATGSVTPSHSWRSPRVPFRHPMEATPYSTRLHQCYWMQQRRRWHHLWIHWWNRCSFLPSWERKSLPCTLFSLFSLPCKWLRHSLVSIRCLVDWTFIRVRLLLQIPLDQSNGQDAWLRQGHTRLGQCADAIVRCVFASIFTTNQKQRAVRGFCDLRDGMERRRDEPYRLLLWVHRVERRYRC